MGSKSSKTKRRPPVKTNTVAVRARIPQEILDEILDYLAADSDLSSLRSYSLVSRSWVPSCRRHLFHTIHFNSRKAVLSWGEAFPVPEGSPARHVRDLYFSTGDSFYETLSAYTPWFTNVERVTLLRDGRWIPTFWRLPQSVTSLTIKTDTSNLVQIRDIMVQLPNLDDLSLSGALVPVDNRSLPRIGTALGGRFGGRLQLTNGYADEDTVNMLLEVPTGLRFTEVEVFCRHKRLLSTVSLADACCNTLVKLSYTVSSYCRFHPFTWSSGF